MSAYYFDSSALVKYYAQEVGTKWVCGLIDAQPSNEIFTALLTGVEIVAAIKRRERMNLIAASDAGATLTAFRNQFRSRFKAFRTSDAVVDRAMNLAEAHKLRGYDAIQLASALLIEERMTAQGVGPLTLISADDELNHAAEAEGLLTDDPNDHP
jgi:predicted nucleic acid-binding protein